MPYKLLINILIFFGISGYVQAQKIFDIEFNGNSKTKDEVLYKTIPSKKGMEYDSARVKEDIKALQGLHLFSDVISEVETVSTDQVKLIFYVKEVFTIIPIVNLGGLTDDHVFWFILGINEFNAFGKGDVISAHYRYFERHSFELFYQDRNFANTPFGLSSFLSIKASIEPLYFADDVIGYFDFTQWRIEELFTHYQSWNSKILFGGGFFREQYILNLDKTIEENIPLVPSKVISDKITLKAIYNLENIDYYGHLLRGHQFTFGTDLIYNINERVFSDALFIKSFFEFKNYHRYTTKSNLASRMFVGFSTNNGSPFTSFVKDDYVNARGVGDRSARGYVELTINNEWRQTIRWKKNHYLQLVGFLDFTSIVPSGQNVSDLFTSANMELFPGVGLRLGLPNIYKTVIRSDLSLDTGSGDISSIIFGLGQFF